MQYIKLNNGEILVNCYGKYQPNLTFLIPEKIQQDLRTSGYLDPEEQTVNIDKLYITEENKNKYNFNIDGSTLQELYGDYWISKKKTNCFRVKDKSNSKHVLLSIGWGGCFNDTRGRILPVVQDKALYYRRASSNGGGTGYTYLIFPKDFKMEYDLEDLI